MGDKEAGEDQFKGGWMCQAEFRISLRRQYNATEGFKQSGDRICFRKTHLASVLDMDCSREDTRDGKSEWRQFQ